MAIREPFINCEGGLANESHMKMVREYGLRIVSCFSLDLGIILITLKV
jgi:hypothetical protein